MSYSIRKEHDFVLSISKCHPWLYALFSFVLTLYVLPLYIDGDQLSYRQFYDQVSFYQFKDAFYFYQNISGSSEPGYFLLGYLFSNVIDKVLLMSFINALLAYSLAKYFLSIRLSPWILGLLLFNYYQMVLFFTAERLKIACLLVLLSLMVRGVWKYIFQVSSLFFHAQVFPMIIGLNWINNIMPVFQSRLSKNKWVSTCFTILLVIPLLWCVFFILKGHIYHKISGAYYALTAEELYLSLAKSGIFYVLSIYYAEKNEKLKAFFLQLPIWSLIFIVGGSRLDILSYFIFFYYASKVSRGLNMGMILSSGYFSVKGLIFIMKIIVTGNGYGD